MDPSKIRAVGDWSTPRNVKDVQRFLGFANFYRIFIKHFRRSSYQSLQSQRKLFLISRGTSGFDKLNPRFISSPLLVHPNPELPFVIVVDASDSAVGAVLSQRVGDKMQLHPCAFLSHNMSSAEKNYDIGRLYKTIKKQQINIAEPFRLILTCEYWTFFILSRNTDTMSSAQEESGIYGEKDHQHPRPTDLSELLKEGTKKSHDDAQNTKFMKDFLKGRIKRELFKELHRAEALQKDVTYFYGEDWKDTIQCSEATQAYVDRIRHLGRHKPELLVAHAYTRYMGDLSGGQVLKKVAQRALHLPNTGEGIQFLHLATGALYYTYSALEEELDRNKENPAIAPLYFPQELHRAEALQKDVTYFYGEDWKDTIQCSEATQAYVDRIRHLGRHKPELLVAHAYTRYMGDLSGGQVLKKVAQRALHLPNTGEGIQFYMFDDVTNAHKFKQLYRARLNTLELNAEVKKGMVEEAKKAFQFNMQLFEELAKIGTTLPDERQDGGEGKGDIHKHPCGLLRMSTPRGGGSTRSHGDKYSASRWHHTDIYIPITMPLL
ncbi:unnamed protein product [Ranitomeya imitator]|uniref:heme oxygenase (biliverdin-producing) n=1 Tax=Ranitomeya imitator TaxID=111125 RepID=A0ABN9L867_9NEOB|nr:unnamed protein product [Ranitomeya imitator]